MPFHNAAPTITTRTGWHEIDGYYFRRASGTCSIFVTHGFLDDQGAVDPSTLWTEEVSVAGAAVLARMTAAITNSTLEQELYAWAVGYVKTSGAIPTNAVFQS